MTTQIIKPLVSLIYSTLIIVGIILLIITIGSTTQSSLIGIISGYSFISGGILLLMANLISNIINNKESNLFSYIYAVGPFSFLLGVVIYSLYLTITYSNRIVSGDITSGYVKFTNISIVLICLQLYLFSTGMKKDSEIIDKKYSMLLYIVGIINLIIIITLGIVMTNFTTDG